VWKLRMFLQQQSPLESATKVMLQLKDAFSNMYSLYAADLTVEVSTPLQRARTASPRSH